MTEKIYIQIDNERFEAKGKDLEDILSAQEELKVARNLEITKDAERLAARESALAKLKALGLTEDEIATL